jgi:hypothetical protein
LVSTRPRAETKLPEQAPAIRSDASCTCFEPLLARREAVQPLEPLRRKVIEQPQSLVALECLTRRRAGRFARITRRKRFERLGPCRLAAIDRVWFGVR